MREDTRDSRPTTRRDAASTLLVIAVVSGVALVRSAPPDPLVFGAGAVGAGVLELLLSMRAAAVRTLWAHRSVQVVAAVVAVVVSVGLATVAGPWVLTATLGGLCGYLALLAVSVWVRRRND